MKSKILKIVLFLIFCNFSFAQNNLKFGINGGMTYSSFRGNPSVENFNSGIDFLTGFSFEYNLKERFSLIVNLNYDRKRASQSLYTEFIENPDDQGFYGNVKIILKKQFITLPILVRYKFGNKNDFYINGGPFISYLLKSQLSNDYDNTSSNETKNFKKIDYGLAFGIGKTFKLKNNNEISFEIRENLGLTDISSINGPIKTNSFNLICNYSFN